MAETPERLTRATFKGWRYSPYLQYNNKKCKNNSADATEVNQNNNYFEGKFSTTSGHTHNGTNSNATLAGTWSGSPIGVAYGGTGIASYASGDMLYATSDTGFARLVKGSIGSVMIVGADKSEPAWLEPGTSGYVLTTQGTGLNPTWTSSGSVVQVLSAIPTAGSTNTNAYADLPNSSISITTGATNIVVLFNADTEDSVAGSYDFYVVNVDGSNVAATERGVECTNANHRNPMTIIHKQTVSAGSHTVKIQFKSDDVTHTAKMDNGILIVMEVR